MENPPWRRIVDMLPPRADTLTGVISLCGGYRGTPSASAARMAKRRRSVNGELLRLRQPVHFLRLVEAVHGVVAERHQLAAAGRGKRLRGQQRLVQRPAQ